MSALDEVNFARIAAVAMAPNTALAESMPTIPPEVVAAIKAEAASLMWEWYHDHSDRIVAHVHMWFFARDVKVQDLHDVFVLLFGADPSVSNAANT